MNAPVISNDYIAVGKLGAPYGVRGWLKLQSFTEHAENMLHYQPWYLCDKNGAFVELSLEDTDWQHNKLMIKIAGIDSPEAARGYTGQLLWAPKEKLPSLPAGEYYWSDLIGLSVVNLQGAPMGVITKLLETGANDVIVVKNDKHEFAIPYLPDRVVKHVDLTMKQMHVDWTEL